MADRVQYFQEESVSELRDLQRRGIFSEDEIRTIVARRREHEYAIQKRAAKKIDFERYIQYEKDLDLQRKKNKETLGITKAGVSDWAITKRICFLYDKSLRKFKSDRSMWLEYIEYCKLIGANKTLTRIYGKMMQLFPLDIDVWTMAARWEFEENGNITTARALMQRALRINGKTSVQMWLEYAKMELDFITMVTERRKVLGISKPAAHPEIDEVEGEGDVVMDDSANAHDFDEEKQFELNEDTQTLLKLPVIIHTHAVKTLADGGIHVSGIEFYQLFKKYHFMNEKCEDMLQAMKLNNDDAVTVTKMNADKSVVQSLNNLSDKGMTDCGISPSVDLDRSIVTELRKAEYADDKDAIKAIYRICKKYKDDKEFNTIWLRTARDSGDDSELKLCMKTIPASKDLEYSAEMIRTRKCSGKQLDQECLDVLNALSITQDPSVLINAWLDCAVADGAKSGVLNRVLESALRFENVSSLDNVVNRVFSSVTDKTKSMVIADKVIDHPHMTASAACVILEHALGNRPMEERILRKCPTLDAYLMVAKHAAKQHDAQRLTMLYNSATLNLKDTVQIADFIRRYREIVSVSS